MVLAYPSTRHRFQFNQYILAATERFEGWCTGISLSMIDYLQRNSGPFGSIKPIDAFHEARQFCQVLTSSVVPYRLDPGFVRYLFDVGVMQNNVGNGTLFQDLDGALMIDLPDPGGVALMLTSIQDNTDEPEFPDHAGVLVWAAQSAFIFDPNLGGMMFSWKTPKDTLPQAIINEVLEHMAKLYGAEVWPYRPVYVCAKAYIDIRFPSRPPGL